jgi:hypothetical protein
MNTHKPTGYSKGRPRKGEVRPPTPGGLYQAKLRAKRRAENEEYWKAYYAGQQAIWVANNPERQQAISRGSYIRAKGWKALELKHPIASFISTAKNLCLVGPPIIKSDIQ